MFLSEHNPDSLVESMNIELLKVVDWLKINKLSLNIKKTHFIIFRRRKEKIVLSKSLKINNVDVDMTEYTKFLGVIIDQNLNFHKHISYIKGKIARTMGILYKAKKIFGRKILLTLYNSFIHPLFMYCVNVWGNAPSVYLDPLIKLQKRATRVIAGATYLAHTAPLFKELKILNLTNIYVYNILLIMFKYHHSKLPTIFDSFFTRNNEVHSYETRQQYHLHVPIQKLPKRTQRVKCAGVTLYNHFVTRLNFNVKIASFKRQAKTYLLDNDVSFLFQ